MSAWGSAEHHRRTIDTFPAAPGAKGSRRCHCGCGGWCTHVGRANGVALVSGCEWRVRRWVHDQDEAALYRHTYDAAAAREGNTDGSD